MRVLTVIFIAWCALAAAGCPADEPACIDVNPDCSELYEPTFDNVFANTLVPSCAPEGGACHSAEGNKGGIAYTDADSAYDILLGHADGRARVIPMDPECSLLTRRIGALRASDLMPPGEPLSAAERCSVEKWVANGAQR